MVIQCHLSQLDQSYYHGKTLKPISLACINDIPTHNLILKHHIIDIL